jgi:RNA polymerase sigma-70 factor (ECF subfamily)
VFFEYYGRIVAVLYRVVGDRARAEELASETFLRLYQQPLAEERYHNLGGWLYRTATRLGIDSLRSSRRRARSEQVAGPGLAGAADDPLDEVLRAERRQQVRAALARLKPFQVQILTLRSSGLSYQEVADALGVKINTVGRRLARAEAAFEKAWNRQRSNHVH